MKEAILDDLTAYVLQAVGPLFGSRSRKQQMQEELESFLGRCSAKKDGERCPVYESLGAMKRKTTNPARRK